MPILFEALFMADSIKHEGGTLIVSRTTLHAKQAVSVDDEHYPPFPSSFRLIVPIDVEMDRALGPILKVTIEAVDLPPEEAD